MLSFGYVIGPEVKKTGDGLCWFLVQIICLVTDFSEAVADLPSTIQVALLHPLWCGFFEIVFHCEAQAALKYTDPPTLAF